jgi:hypothetical protein
MITPAIQQITAQGINTPAHNPGQPAYQEFYFGIPGNLIDLVPVSDQRYQYSVEADYDQNSILTGSKFIITKTATSTPITAEYTFDIPFFLWLMLFLIFFQLIWLTFKIIKNNK